jgi:hypothetical protein
LIAPAQEVSSTEVVNPADNARVVNLQIIDTQVDKGGDANPASVQKDTPDADDAGATTTTTKKPAASENKHVRLNVKKINPLAGPADTKAAATGSSDPTDSDPRDVGKHEKAGAGDADPAGVQDNNAGDENADAHTDADQG